MTDTSKTFTELKALFAVQTTQQIGAQDHLDFIESIFQYGSLRMVSSDTPAGQVIGTAYEKLTQFTKKATPSSDITSSVVDDSFTIARGGVYAILISLSFSGSNNSIWTGSLFKSGEDQEVCSLRRKLGSVNDLGTAASFDCLVTAAGDVIDYRLKADAASKTFTLETGSFVMFRIG